MASRGKPARWQDAALYLAAASDASPLRAPPPQVLQDGSVPKEVRRACAQNPIPQTQNPPPQVLQDGSVPKEVRRARAQGLRELGRIFSSCAAEAQAPAGGTNAADAGKRRRVPVG